MTNSRAPIVGLPVPVKGDLDARIRDWERRLEDMLIEMSMEKTDEGFLFANVIDGDNPLMEAPIVRAFDGIVSRMRGIRDNGKLVLIPGNCKNEE